ncbi:MAG: LysR family transcriptional regulator [Alphaproteobacteria bacterium]
MTFKQFEALYWVARLGSFHAAARHLRTSQPTISARIRELEKGLGIDLFDRSQRRARPNAKGRELLRYAEDIMRIGAEIQQHVGTRDALRGRVRLGVTSVPAATWLPRLVRRIAQAYPGILLEYTVDTSENLAEQLRAGEVDVAFLSAQLPAGARITAEPVGRVELAWLAAPGLALPSGRVAPKDLAGASIISDVRGSQLHAVAEAWFRDGGAAPGRHHACSSLIGRIRLAAEGMGVALATPAAAMREIAEDALRVLAAEPPLPALEYVIASSAAGAAPAVEVVAALARDLIAEKPGIQFYYSAARPTA